MNTGKCPSCGQIVSKVDTEHLTIGVPPKRAWHGISYVCPECRVILGVQIDPVALKSDIVKELSQKIADAS